MKTDPGSLLWSAGMKVGIDILPACQYKTTQDLRCQFYG